MRQFAAVMLLLTTVAFRPSVGSAQAKPRTIEVVGTDDMKYNVTTIAAKPGEQIRIRLTVKGNLPKIAMAHNVVVLKLGTDIPKLLAEGAPHRATDFIPPAMMSSVVAKTPMAGKGETVEVTFKAPAKAGQYPYICTFAGHYQAGMKGTLVVK